jgi:acetyl-CoA C-acetyltransferase
VSRGAGSDDRTPILVGAGQLTQRDVAPAEALEPLAMMEVVARRAADDAGAGAALLARVDSLAVVNVFCWPYANPPRLGGWASIRPRRSTRRWAAARRSGW